MLRQTRGQFGQDARDAAPGWIKRLNHVEDSKHRDTIRDRGADATKRDTPAAPAAARC